MRTRTLVLGLLWLSGSLVACYGAIQPEYDTSTERAPVCVSATSLTLAPRGASHDALDEALSRIGLNRESFALSASAVAQNGLMPSTDPRRLADLDTFGRAPVMTAEWGTALASMIDQAAASTHPVSDLLSLAQARRKGAAASPACTANRSVELGTALDAAGAVPRDWSAVPSDLQRAIAPIVLSLVRASDVVARERAKGSAYWSELLAVSAWLLGTHRLSLSPELSNALESFDVDAIADAAREVTLAVETANLGRFRGAQTPHMEVATKYGALVLSGPSSDTYAKGHPWLSIDTGGDDVYRTSAGGADLNQSVSVAIDLGGDDTYAYEVMPAEGDTGHRLPSDGHGRVAGRTLSRSPRQGAAILGIGMSFDLGGGQDTRSSLALSQGAAVLGVGVTYDDGGDDVYEAEIFSQGASAWGVGLLIDAGGNDRYFAYKQAQGFGGVRGVGGLIDVSGRDHYAADSGVRSLGGDTIYSSAQLPGDSNESFAQGCGAGRRDDEPGGPLPGGLGLLRDGAGDDVYSASVFAQGCGFAMGMGALLDASGDDSYDALYYAQGAGVHLSAATLIDAGSDDRYNARFPATAALLGVGHDVSVGVFADLDGNDIVIAPALSAGAGIANGLGLMLVARGSDDLRAASGGAWGVAAAASPLTPWRANEKTIGVFVHASGAATYLGEGPLELGGTSTHRDGSLAAIGVDRPLAQIVLR